MPNRPHKPVELRTGHRKHYAVDLAEQPVLDVIPPCPDGLTPAVGQWWDVFWRSPIASLILPTERHCIARYAFLLSERERLEVKANLDRNDRALLNLRIREIQTTEERFGISPLSRMRLGLVYGKAEKSLEAMHQRHEKPKMPVRVVIED